mgnify:CR=1 FL=1
MTCNSIRKHIEAADEALREATILALKNKQDEQLETLFEALGKVRELILTTPIRFTDNTSEYYRNNAEYNFNLESDINLETGGYKVPADVITFPTDYSGDDISIDTSDIAAGTVNIPVGAGEDGADMGAFGVGCGRIAQTIHVSTTGSDETGNGSEQNPYATIEKANYEVDYYYNENYESEAIEWTGITVSDTILVHDGTYEIDNLIGGYYDYSDKVTIITSLNGPSSTFLVPQENAGEIGSTLASFDISGFTLTGMNFSVYASFISFKNCIIEETAQFSASTCHLHCFVFENTTFINNNQNYDFNGPPFFNNSIILNNEGLDMDTDNIYFTLNDLGLNENGNITDLNPLFCDPDNGDYSLAENSPAVGAGEDGVDMGALGVGCETIELAPIISEIDDQQINEDGSISIEVSATSEIGATMIFTALSDTSDVALSLDNSTLTANPSPDWNGIASIMVIVTDENDLSDSTSFSLNVAPVNDSPEEFNVLYPTVSDTFSTHMDSDTVIAFLWEESHDIDSDVAYTLTIEFEFFGNVYSDVHESIEDTIFFVSSNSLNPILDATAQDIAVFNYYVHSTDGDFVVLSSLGEFVVSRESLSLSDAPQVPMAYTLYQNYPNPFNPVTTLRYDLPKDGFVNITIYDMLGNVINQLVNEVQNSGYKSIQWNANNNQGHPVSAGVYLYSIEAGDIRQTKKMILLK